MIEGDSEREWLRAGRRVFVLIFVIVWNGAMVWTSSERMDVHGPDPMLLVIAWHRTLVLIGGGILGLVMLLIWAKLVNRRNGNGL